MRQGKKSEIKDAIARVQHNQRCIDNFQFEVLSFKALQRGFSEEVVCGEFATQLVNIVVETLITVILDNFDLCRKTYPGLRKNAKDVTSLAEHEVENVVVNEGGIVTITISIGQHTTTSSLFSCLLDKTSQSSIIHEVDRQLRQCQKKGKLLNVPFAFYGRVVDLSSTSFWNSLVSLGITIYCLVDLILLLSRGETHVSAKILILASSMEVLLMFLIISLCPDRAFVTTQDRDMQEAVTSSQWALICYTILGPSLHFLTFIAFILDIGYFLSVDAMKSPMLIHAFAILTLVCVGFHIPCIMIHVVNHWMHNRRKLKVFAFVRFFSDCVRYAGILFFFLYKYYAYTAAKSTKIYERGRVINTEESIYLLIFLLAALPIISFLYYAPLHLRGAVWGWIRRVFFSFLIFIIGAMMDTDLNCKYVSRDNPDYNYRVHALGDFNHVRVLNICRDLYPDVGRSQIHVISMVDSYPARVAFLVAGYTIGFYSN